MSSNRHAPQPDGVLIRDGEPIGPMRMPENRPDDFVDHFNRTYQGIGLSVQTVGDFSEVATSLSEKPK